MKSNWILGALLSLLVTYGVKAEECQDSETLLECFTRIAVSEPAAEALEGAEERLDEIPNASGTPGSTSAAKDFLRRLIVASGIGEVNESEVGQSLSLTLTPRNSPVTALLQVTRKDPELFETLLTAIPEDARDAQRGALQQELGDFDDMEVSLSFNLETEHFGRSLDLGNVPTADFDMQQLLSFTQEIGVQIDQKFDSISSPGLKDKAKEYVVAAALSERASASELEALSADLAMKADRTQQLHFETGIRNRDSLVGPDEYWLKGTYEFKSKKWGRLAGALEWVRTQSYDSPLPDVDLRIDRTRQIVGSATYGIPVTFDKEQKVTSRIDFESKYEDAAGDEMRNNRWVTTATYTVNAGDGNPVSLSLVYANKPEYLGEVDEEFSARFGIKVKVDRKAP